MLEKGYKASRCPLNDGKRPVSYTHLVDGKSYHFISMEEMNALDKQQKIVERRNYNTVNGLWSYATNAENIRLSENYLVANTWEGYQKYLEFYGKENVVPRGSV